LSQLVFSEALDPGGGGPAGGGGPKLSPEVIEARIGRMTRPFLSAEGFKSNPPPSSRGNKKVETIGILTSGGDGPAENAAIEALVYGATQRLGWKVFGIREGFKGLLEPEGRVFEMDIGDVQGAGAVRAARRLLYGTQEPPQRHDQGRNIRFLGGNILRSSRANPIEVDGAGKPNADRIRETLRHYGIDALVIMGGNGTQRAAKELSDLGVDLVFLPQSIDADVPGSIVSIGFPSAVNRGALEIPEFLNTAQSCNRWFLVEVMGQKYGMLNLGIAHSASRGLFGFREFKDQPPVHVGGVFSELPRSMGEIPAIIRRHKAQGIHHGVILLSEGVQFHEAVPPRATDANQRMLIEAGDISR